VIGHRGRWARKEVEVILRRMDNVLEQLPEAIALGKLDSVAKKANQDFEAGRFTSVRSISSLLISGIIIDSYPHSAVGYAHDCSS
jgi:hypothetical protein